MKKIWLIVMVLILMASLGWGLMSLHTRSQARRLNLIHISQNALVEQKYARAENYLQMDINVNSGHQGAKHLLDQTQDYLDGNRYLNNNRLNLATIEYRKGIRSSSVILHKRSSRQIHLINDMKRKAVHYNQIYNQAVVDNHQGKFKKSNRKLFIFMNDPQLRLNYFRTLRILANHLKRLNDDGSLSSQVERNCFPGLALVVEKRTVHSVRNISAAKGEIKAAGINVNRMNRRMILNIIKQARHHHMSVSHYAKKNY